MSKKFFTIFLVTIIILPIFLFAGTVHVGEDYSLRKGEEVNDDLYVAGKNTSVAGNVTGDLFAVGLNVSFGGNNVSEDALVIGATVNVVSDVKEDLRIVGGKAYFGGSVGQDLAALAQEIQTLPDSVIAGNFLAASGRVILNGEVKGDVQIAGGAVFINDKVGGDVSISANRIVIGPHAVIGGKFNYASGNPAEISDGAVIIGETIYKAIDARPSAERFLPTLWGTWVLIHYVVLLISALILHAVFRTISLKFVSTSIHHFGWSVLRGFVFVVAVPIAIALVFLTFVGIPFGFLGVALYTIFLLIAWVYGSILAGSVVRRLVKTDDVVIINWKTILVGTALTVALSYVPYVGGLVRYVLILASLGGIYQVLFDKFVEVR